MRLVEFVKPRTSLVAGTSSKFPGRVTYWTFDEPSGQTVSDQSTSGNDGFLGLDPGADSADPFRVDSDAPICKHLGFDRFELQKASLKFFHPGLDSFHFSAELDLNENSDGIDPGGEDVTVSFGTYTETLLAGAFDCGSSDCVYKNRRGRGISRATIGDGFLEFKARHVDLSDTANPLEISVQIGNDSGNAAARLGGPLHLCGLGFELVLLLPPLMWAYGRRRRRIDSESVSPRVS